MKKTDDLVKMMGDEDWVVRKVAAKRQTKETAILGELLECGSLQPLWE